MKTALSIEHVASGVMIIVHAQYANVKPEMTVKINLPDRSFLFMFGGVFALWWSVFWKDAKFWTLAVTATLHKPCLKLRRFMSPVVHSLVCLGDGLSDGEQHHHQRSNAG